MGGRLCWDALFEGDTISGREKSKRRNGEERKRDRERSPERKRESEHEDTRKLL